MASRERSGRIEQACQSCRQLKARCIRGGEPGPCQRCRDFDRTCIWPEIRERRRPRPRASGISRVEHKLDGLVNHMSAALRGQESDISRESSVRTTRRDGPISRMNPHTPVSQNSEHSSAETSAANTATATTLDELAQIHDFSTPQSRSSAQYRESSTPGPDIFRDLISDERLDELLDEYRSMSSAFPFVPLKPNVNVSMMRRSKPMLLLAMAAAASSRDRQLQVLLDQRYREELASHTIISPRKSTGLVQSLLVYLAWYHYFFSHKTQNIFPLVQLLVGLTIDVGLHQDKGRKVLPGITPETQRERDRALLGCYFLSSTISGAMRKTNLFKRPSIFDACLSRLREGADFESDAAIEKFVRCLHLDEEASELVQELRNETCEPPIFNFKAVEADMHHYYQGVSGTIHNEVIRTAELLYHSTKMELYSAVVQRWHDLNESPREYPTGAEDSVKIAACLDAGKTFLEMLLEHSVQVYPLIPFVVWMRLPVVIVTLTPLTLGPETSSYDRRLRLELYLEALCNRMQMLTTCCPPHQPIPDFWKAMFVIMDQARTWYTNRVKSLVQTSENHVQPKTPFCPFKHADLSGDLLEGHADLFSAEPTQADVSSDFDDFFTLDLWGGSESYDPTIINFEDIISGS